MPRFIQTSRRKAGFYEAYHNGRFVDIQIVRNDDRGCWDVQQSGRFLFSAPSKGSALGILGIITAAFEKAV